MRHELKIETQYYNAILRGEKKFEIRKNDRNFRVGDTIELRPWNSARKVFLASPAIQRKILYITDYAQKDGYVVFSI